MTDSLVGEEEPGIGVALLGGRGPDSNGEKLLLGDELHPDVAGTRVVPELAAT